VDISGRNVAQCDRDITVYSTIYVMEPLWFSVRCSLFYREHLTPYVNVEDDVVVFIL
jgi:hypothetical protein